MKVVKLLKAKFQKSSLNWYFKYSTNNTAPKSTLKSESSSNSSPNSTSAAKTTSNQPKIFKKLNPEAPTVKIMKPDNNLVKPNPEAPNVKIMKPNNNLVRPDQNPETFTVKIMKPNNNLVRPNPKLHQINKLNISFSVDELDLLNKNNIFSYENFLENYTNFNPNYLNVKIKKGYVNMCHKTAFTTFNANKNSNMLDKDIQSSIDKNVHFLKNINAKFDSYTKLYKTKKPIQKEEVYNNINFFVQELFKQKKNEQSKQIELYDNLISFLDEFVIFFMHSKINEMNDYDYQIIMNRLADMIKMFDLINYETLKTEYIEKITYILLFFKPYFKITESTFGFITYLNKIIERSLMNKDTITQEEKDLNKKHSGLLTYLILNEDDDIHFCKFMSKLKNTINYGKDINETLFILNFIISRSIINKERVLQQYEREPNKFIFENIYNSFVSHLKKHNLSLLDFEQLDIFTINMMYLKQTQDYFKGLIFNKDSDAILQYLYSGKLIYNIV